MDTNTDNTDPDNQCHSAPFWNDMFGSCAGITRKEAGNFVTKGIASTDSREDGDGFVWNMVQTGKDCNVVLAGLEYSTVKSVQSI